MARQAAAAAPVAASQHVASALPVAPGTGIDTMAYVVTCVRVLCLDVDWRYFCSRFVLIPSDKIRDSPVGFDFHFVLRTFPCLCSVASEFHVARLILKSSHCLALECYHECSLARN